MSTELSHGPLQEMAAEARQLIQNASWRILYEVG